MPKRIPWLERVIAADEADADVVLVGFKSYDVAKSNTMACTMCLASEHHRMRYRLLVCTSSACSEAQEDACAWRGKILTCLSTNRVSVYDYGDHTAEGFSPKKKKLSASQKTFCREMAKNHLRPLRIRHAMARKFSTPLENLPNLSVVQNFVNHYSRTNLENHDRVDEIREWIHARNFTGAESKDQAFTFSWEVDEKGKSVVGNGSDAKPFILHVDATYKMNHRGYPVVVVGISDRARVFHLVALFIVSQETQPIFEAVLLSLRRLFYYITCRDLVVRYALADADQAQYNALSSKTIKGFPSLLSSSVMRDVYDLHFVRSEFDFVRMREQILSNWKSNPYLVGFAQYMTDQWLYGRYWKWQRYFTPPGFASTNNPVETFNARLKRDYTLRRRLKMGTLLRELSACCHDVSSTTRSFSFEIAIQPTLTRRVSEMVKQSLIGFWNRGCSPPACAVSSDTVHVVSRMAQRVQVAPHKRTEVGIAVSAQMGANYARMEVQGQPWGGWPVDITHRWCPCGYCYAFGICVHVLFALRATETVDSSGRNVLVNRNKRKRSGGDSGGRPRAVGPDLTF
ncbi:hypothetical protein F441_17225 [Phytophthora nicotianae CJ01A1]|uniref:MULE transposase domain-containing protein n=3 Tax=Phytophthora nicotianae TaxID=4792 RepID=V9EBM4_PHYNI|nr:hypothetical protein F443_17353 [Phytophthora nicotianae P1569]ETK76793.1 hypothetical protein L915_16871 [Phytophthora nicotianae]ETP06365.1 hypothetical protein F441_17225 [Phytophthora nicotianae CJ01A1]